jgi:hypothetical protein
MKCPRCLNGPEARKVDMRPVRNARDQIIRGEYACPECPATMRMDDLGFQPFVVEKAQPSPLRVPEPGGRAPIERPCKVCGTLFSDVSQAECCSSACRGAMWSASYYAKREEIPAEAGWHQSAVTE